MAAENDTIELPTPESRSKEANARKDQDINPWSVAGAEGENGEVEAIDYLAICRYVPRSHEPWGICLGWPLVAHRHN